MLSFLDYLSKKISLKFWGDIALLAVAYGCVVALDVLLQRYFSFSHLHNLVAFTRYFMLGYLMRKHDVLKRLLLSDVACAAGLCLYLLQVYFTDCYFKPLILLGPLGGTMVAWRFFERSFSADSRAGRWLSTVGRSTLYIYCAHWFLLSDLTAYATPYVDVPMGFFVQLAGSLVYALLVVAALMAVEKIITHNSILNTLLLGAKPSRAK